MTTGIEQSSQVLPQRVVFGTALAKLGAEFPHLVVLDADVSSSTQTALFAQAYPKRFFNFGIAEANMVSAAAGMAAVGLLPVVSTFAFLLAVRAGDAVRSLVAYNRLNVKMAGGYAGLSDFADGASHQSVEDLAVMTGIPNITVVAPCDAVETRLAVRAMLEHAGPVYLRLSRAVVPTWFDDDHPFEIGKGIMLRDGGDVTLIGTGPMVAVACSAADLLAQRGIAARVIDMHTIKPLDHDVVMRAARETGAIVTVEEHNIHGGLGSAVCAAVAESEPAPVTRCGIPDRFGESGAYTEILARAGLDAEHVAAAAEQTLRRKLSNIQGGMP